MASFFYRVGGGHGLGSAACPGSAGLGGLWLDLVVQAAGTKHARLEACELISGLRGLLELEVSCVLEHLLLEPRNFARELLLGEVDKVCGTAGHGVGLALL